jgi:hypothetical protein
MPNATRWGRAALCVAALFVVPFTAHAQTPAPTVSEQTPPPRLRQRDFSETTLTSRDGLEYRLLVSVPRGPAPAGGFPVFYVLAACRT